jgi:hypothetical protein
MTEHQEAKPTTMHMTQQELLETHHNYHAMLIMQDMEEHS